MPYMNDVAQNQLRQKTIECSDVIMGDWSDFVLSTRFIM